MVLKTGLMELDTRDNMLMEKSMVKANYIFLMDPIIKENSSIMIYKVQEYICGLMNVGTRDNGIKIKCMGKAK